MTRVLLGLHALLLLAACEKGAPKAATPTNGETNLSGVNSPANDAAAAPADSVVDGSFKGRRAPLKVEVRGPDNPQPNSEIEVVVSIERRTPHLPVDLSVHLPAGATLVRGLPSEHIETEGAKLERRYIVRLGSVPTTDIEITAQAYDQDLGVRGRGMYRFGRPEPRLPEPNRSDRPTVLGDQDFGRPVELKPERNVRH
ncbi:MAG TPA: hypothetical protein VFQ61_02810 [Polyangiaceae bacterium]|nr:hypothetical protein [Polyangiaceae bacterium]